jgi:acetyl-CoA C-acetyltransferase
LLQAGTGEAPARQAAIYAGLPNTLLVLLNKVCASGMKAVMMGAQAIQAGDAEIVLQEEWKT